MQTASVSSTTWFLRGRLAKDAAVQSIPIKQPFMLGRNSDCDLCLSSPAVSSRHAEMIFQENGLLVRDLGSTNGTFLNGVPLHEPKVLKNGDLVQFADLAFRVCAESPSRLNQTVQSGEEMLDSAFSLFQFDKLMSQQSVVPHYQPLVEVPSGRVFGYEVLGRSCLVGLETPKAMFLAASQLNMEAELSRLMRLQGMNRGATLPGLPALFLNTHPSEVVDFGLLNSLAETRRNHPEQPIVLEIHEAAVTDGDSMRTLRTELNALNIGMAYDDFGAGQSRLRDIFDVPPDYLKFDMSLIRSIDTASSRRQEMLAGLVRSVSDMDIVPLAEGVETEAEHNVLVAMGFTTAQGFYYGRPESCAVVASEIDSASLQNLI